MSRRYRGQRSLRIAARTVHLIAMAGLFGGALATGELGSAFLAMLLLSGAWIATDDLYKHGADWFRFVQGWAVLAKLGLLLLALVAPSSAPGALLVAIVIGGVVSHAPGRVRQVALWGEPGPCARRELRAD